MRQCQLSDNEPAGKDWLTAGDSGHGGANQRHARVRNSIAHPLEALSTAEVAQNGGEPERGGAATHGQKTQCKERLRSGYEKLVPASRD